jgi:transcriptional regulator with XRE-family HTH domain
LDAWEYKKKKDGAMKITNHAKRMRLEKGWSLEQLAEKVGKAPSQVWKMENGHIRLNDHWLDILSEAFQCSPLDVISPEGEGSPGYGHIDAALFDGVMHSLEKALAERGGTIARKKFAGLAAEFYNYIQGFRSKGKDVEPNEALAALFLDKQGIS